MNNRLLRAIHIALALSDVALIVVVGVVVIHGFAWIFFPQVFNRGFEIITLLCLSDYRPLTFSAIQPLLTTIGALVETNQQHLAEGFAPLLVWEVLILVYVRYANVYFPALDSRPEVHIAELIPRPGFQSVEVLHVHRLLYVVIEQPDKTKCIGVRNEGPTMAMAA